MTPRRAAATLLMLSLLCAPVTAQSQQPILPASVDRKGVPRWENQTLPRDVFTFVRIHYHSNTVSNRWLVDYPDSDLNLSLRLQELTSMRIDPDPICLKWQDPKLFDYPFVYVVEPGFMHESAASLAAMGEYCRRGGFVMFDDFWGDAHYQNLERQLRQAFPGKRIIDLTIEHPIFHSVFDLKEIPQVHPPGNGARNPQRVIDIHGPVHYRAIYDDDGRMMVLICHNTDIGDAWEREGIDEWYFHEYAEKKAYPIAINILFYVMTH